MKHAFRIGIPALLIAAGVAAFVLAQPDVDGLNKPYEFKLGSEITAQAAEVVIEPRFRAIADDRFAYECYSNAVRSGTVSDAGKPVESFRISENWINHFTLIAGEDPLEGRKDLRLSFQFDVMQFMIDNGEARYTGFIGPQSDLHKTGFQEVLPGGERSEVTNIPGWVGVNASSLEQNRGTQARDFSASAWFSASETGRLHHETYYADYGFADQANYPGRLQDPLHIALSVQPEFSADAKLKIGETLSVRRRFPVGASFGGTIEYDFTYKLEKLYGTVAEPTAARLSFDAVPVKREREVTVNGLKTRFSAPDIKGGQLLLDLVKGVAAHVQWEYRLGGTVSQPGSELATVFDVKFDFSASLRASAPKQE